MTKNEGKWGKMGENGEKWGEVGSCYKYIMENVCKCSNKKEKWRKMV